MKTEDEILREIARHQGRVLALDSKIEESQNEWKKNNYTQMKLIHEVHIDALKWVLEQALEVGR